MSYTVLFVAVGLVLVLEGILPFLSPRLWRETMVQLSAHSDRVLRVIGFISMLVGLLIVTIVHQLST